MNGKKKRVGKKTEKKNKRKREKKPKNSIFIQYCNSNCKKKKKIRRIESKSPDGTR